MINPHGATKTLAEAARYVVRSFSQHFLGPKRACLARNAISRRACMQNTEAPNPDGSQNSPPFSRRRQLVRRSGAQAEVVPAMKCSIGAAPDDQHARRCSA